MSADLGENVVDIAELPDRIYVFRDRAHAGKAVAGMLEEHRDTNALVLGIPARRSRGPSKCRGTSDCGGSPYRT